MDHGAAGGTQPPLPISTTAFPPWSIQNTYINLPATPDMFQTCPPLSRRPTWPLPPEPPVALGLSAMTNPDVAKARLWGSSEGFGGGFSDHSPVDMKRSSSDTVAPSGRYRPCYRSRFSVQLIAQKIPITAIKIKDAYISTTSNLKRMRLSKLAVPSTRHLRSQRKVSPTSPAISTIQLFYDQSRNVARSRTKLHKADIGKR